MPIFLRVNAGARYGAFDVCAANRVLNMLAAEAGKEYDDGGKMAANGNMNERLMEQLNALEYYKQPYPKSLANDFGTDTVYPMIKKSGCSIDDALRTYTEHIALQIKNAISLHFKPKPQTSSAASEARQTYEQTSLYRRRRI